MEIQWNQLKETADKEKGFRFTPPPGEAMAARVGWKDRFWGAMLSGSIPALLMSIALMAWMSQNALSLAALVGAAPLLAWFCLPLMRRGATVSLWRVLWTLPLLLVMSSTAMLLPTVGQYTSHGDPLHKEVLVATFQTNLESVLSWPAILTILALTLALTTLASKPQEARPWLEPRPARRISLAWRAMSLLSVALALAWLHSQTYLTKSERAWVSEQEKFYQSRPFRTFPEKSESDFWREQIVSVSEGRDYSLLLLKDHPPLDREELDAAESYLFRALPGNGLSPYERCLAMLDFVQINFQLRPNGNRAYLDRVLAELVGLVGESTLTADQLQKIQARLEEVKDELFERSRELDQEAYRDLWAETDEFDQAIGWYSPYSVMSWQRERKMGWTYNGVSPATGLRVLSWELDWSPTIWLKHYQQTQMTREWLNVREEISELTVPQQVAYLGQLCDSMPQPDTRERRFWDSLRNENQVTLERDLIEQALNTLARRLQSPTEVLK